MNKDINIIFTENIEYLIQLEKVIKEFRCQNFYQALQHFRKIINRFTETINLIFRCKDYFNQQYIIIDEKMFVQTLEQIMSAQENEDYVLLADLLELQLMPYLITIQNIIQQDDNIKLEFYRENYALLKECSPSLCIDLENIEYPDSRIYQIESTSIGVKTLKISSEQTYYMHSNGNPYKEADDFVDAHYDSNVHRYIFFGLGLGYHIHGILAKNPINKIEVYEMDINVIRLALEHSDMTEFLHSKRLTINYDPELGKLVKRLRSNMYETIFLMHQPSIRNIKNKEIRQSMEDYFISYSSLKNQEEILRTNFVENIKLHDPSVDVLREELAGKKLIIVAGGPSLDKNIEILQRYYASNKDKTKDYKIIVVGTVLKKVLELGIVPDYVIMSDAQPWVKGQVDNIDASIVPLIYLSTVAYEAPKVYQGKRYIIFQEDFQMAEKHGREIDATFFKTGGSVSTTALDLGLRMKCISIIFIGLDLAYTNLQTHATKTSGRMVIDKDNLREVLSIDGEVIYTGKNLDSYRKWIERRIADETEVEIIDATEGGALIRGMIRKKLSEVLI